MTLVSTTFEAVRRLCTTREVDLVFSTPPPPFVLCLHGEFDGYGDFLSIVAQGVEYADVAGVTVGDLLLTTDMKELASIAAKWAHVPALYSGPALAIRSADAPSWQDARPHELFVVIANELTFRAGVNFHDVG